MFSILQIANVVKGEIEGNPNLMIKGVCDLLNGYQNHISYILPGKYESYFETTKAEALLINKNCTLNTNNKTCIRVINPALSFIDIIHMFYPKKQSSYEIHPKAIINDNAKLGAKVKVGPCAVIDGGVKIGNFVSIGANSVIGENTSIGDKTTISSNVSIYNNVIIGNNCIIDSGSVIGADGFGLVTKNNIHYKMPHVGKVIIKDNVWIGANCCIDRGTLVDTIIDKGTKLDNLIQIAHNVKIGKNCRISGQTAIAGSSVLEDNVTLAGQVGIIDHLIIGKNSIVASKSAVYESLEPNSFVSGTPAKPHKNRLRQEVVINQLPDLLNRIRKLEKCLVSDKEI